MTGSIREDGCSHTPAEGLRSYVGKQFSTCVRPTAFLPLLLFSSLNASAQTVIYIHTDALGSVVAESDVEGNVTKRYDYEPYGAVIGGNTRDGPGYTGHVSDATTGLSYMQQRYYDPQLGML